MMHDVYAKMVIIFLKGFIEVNCKHCIGTWFYSKIMKTFAIGSLFKSKNETKEKALNKS